MDANNWYGYAMPKFLPTGWFKWIDPQKSNLNKYNKNISKDCVLEVDLEYPKELHELHNDYLLAPDKTEIKRKMLSKYQLLIADSYNISSSNVKELVPTFFDEQNYVFHYENIQLYLRLVLKLKRNIAY